MPIPPIELPTLPITEVIGEIQQQLTSHHQLVLEAPPGAGKTTLVPLALLSEPWLQGQRIIMLEPRRMAARAAAQRMASLLNEAVGKTVGYRVRQDSKVSKDTRIEVITEGILTRMLLQDPALEGVGLVIFDEFHERSIDADFGLALALQGRELFRDISKPLRLMIMSATLDGEAIASLLDDASIIRSAGKMFPVTLHYGTAKSYHENIVDTVINALQNIITLHSSSILVFLPGQGEITRVMQRLASIISEQDIILPLYGALSMREQQRAIDPIIDKRKIVLATDIAETSLTIEGIHVVVDAGLCREPQFDPATGMTRLQTRRISQHSSIQRMGRAGRLAAGHCYRLWSEEQQYQLAQQSTPQILQADLAPLVLQLLAWGVDDIHELKWLDTPPAGALSQALDLLIQLGAVTKKTTADLSGLLKDYALSSHGELMSTMPTHPRLAHMLLCSRAVQQTQLAATLAALLADRNPLSRDYGADLSQPLAVISGETPCHSQHRGWLQRSQKQANTFSQFLSKITTAVAIKPLTENSALGYLLACAYPDRIGRRKPGSTNSYLLSNGRAAILNPKDALNQHQWLAVAELGGGPQYGDNKNSDKIFSALPFDAELLDNVLKELVEEKDQLHWDQQTDRFTAEHIQSLGSIVLKRKPIDSIPAEAKKQALLALIKKRGLSLLPWTDASRQWQARVMLLHSIDAQWPDVSDQQLLLTIEQWLSPFIDSINKLGDFKKLELQNILNTLLSWPLPQQLQELAPTHITVPSGSRIKIDYSQRPPVLSVKLQEMFGCPNTPSIAQGKIKLMLHLLSPAQRPLQVTQDLQGFWNSSYFEVKKEMKGRYPKHPWPDNPLEALATRFTKHRPKKR